MRRTFSIVILLTGFVSIPTQVLLIREFILVFGGNELIIGIFLAAWMLFTALGSVLAPFIPLKEGAIPVVTLSWLIMPLVLLGATDLAGGTCFLPGVDAGPVSGTIICLAIMFPFCFGSGYIFSSLSKYYGNKEFIKAPGRTYSIESVGSVAGGALLSFGLIYLRDNFKAAAVISLITTVVFLYRRSISASALILSMGVIGFSCIVLLTGSKPVRRVLFSGQSILESKDSPYGNFTATLTNNQLNLYANHRLMFSGNNPQASEEAVHFALLQISKPEHVLLVSGGLAGLTDEILKHGSVLSVDYLEIDPVILQYFQKYKAGSSPKVNCIQEDPRIYLRSCDATYDAVIVSLPEPTSFQLNRYYSQEYLQLAKSRMKPGGVFTYTLPIGANYLNSGMIQVYSSLLQTCRSVFSQVIIFHGINGTLVASDANLRTDVSHLSEIKQFKSDYINYYINDPDLRRRSVELTKQLYLAPVNTDYNSLAVKGFYQSWAEMYGFSMTRIRLAGFILLVVVMILIVLWPPVTSAIFTAGLSSSALQVIIILAYQVVYGQVLGMMGLLTAMFMGGLALGSSFGKFRNEPRYFRSLPVLLLLLSALACLLPLVISLSARLFPWPFWVGLLFATYATMVAFITGRVFSVSASLSGGNSIPVVYGADMSGAASGAVLVVLVMIPFAGIRLSPLLTAIPGIWLAISMTIRQKMRSP